MSILAEAIVSYTVEKIGDLVIDLAIQEVIFLRGVRGEVNSIKSELRAMQAFLRDADAQGKQGDKVAKNWVMEVRDAACDAEDAVEMFCLRVELKRRRRTKPTKIFTYFFNDLYHLHKIGSKIKEIKIRISDIHRRSSVYKTTEAVGGPSSSHHRSKLLEYRKNAAVAEDDGVVGLEGDAETLVARLTKGDKDRRVVSIVAMGGAGKTTLANKIYRRREVEEHFGGSLAWVCVSQSYDPKDILQDIAKQIMGMSKQDSGELGVKDLQRRVSQFLAGRRYLIVLDDIWENDAWDQVEAAFPTGKNGGRIVLTTRNKAVASRVDPEPFELPLLQEEESWTLFLKKAFPGENDAGTSCREELKEIGKQIVAKCGGLPLAIKVIGGVIAAKNRTRPSWLSVLNSLPQQLSKDEVHCSDILALSYEDLPYYLKPCFLHLGLFPEDQSIPAKKLIRLWVAEGFIQRRGQQEILEDVGEEYLEELISRCMIQAERGYDRSVRTCRIHDLLHNLAMEEGRKNCFLEIDRNLCNSIPTVVRQLAVHNETDGYDSIQCSAVLNIRSLLCFAKTMPKLPDGAAKFLRVLDLEFASVPGNLLFDAMGTLNHLKYLSLNGNHVGRIPPSIANLYKLETLLLHHHGEIPLDPLFRSKEPTFTMPEAIWSMNQLRHLVAYGCRFEGLPQLHRLKNLHTLSLTSGNWIEEDSLSRLSASLRILKVHGDLNRHKDMLWRSIAKLVNIQSLVLKTEIRHSINQFLLPPTMSFKEHVLLDKMTLKGGIPKLLHVHHFPPNLTKLTLEDSLLKEDPMTILEKLQNLQILKLRANSYVGEKMIASAQGFPQLRYLELTSLHEVDGWAVEKQAMPVLECLHIESCEKLKKLPHGLCNVSTLLKLVISRMPAEFCGRLLEIDGEDWYKIKHIPTVHVRRW